MKDMKYLFCIVGFLLVTCFGALAQDCDPKIKSAFSNVFNSVEWETGGTEKGLQRLWLVYFVLEDETKKNNLDRVLEKDKDPAKLATSVFSGPQTLTRNTILSTKEKEIGDTLGSLRRRPINRNPCLFNTFIDHLEENGVDDLGQYRFVTPKAVAVKKVKSESEDREEGVNTVVDHDHANPFQYLYFLFLPLLLFCVYFWMQSRKMKRRLEEMDDQLRNRSTKGKGEKQSGPDLQKLTDRVSHLEAEKDRIIEKVNGLIGTIRNMKDSSPRGNIKSGQRQEKPTPAPAAPLQFARNAEMLQHGIGFRSLKAEADGKSIFICQVSPDGGMNFHITEVADTQELALSDIAGYLDESCTYETDPREGNQIRTREAGRAKKETDGWVITQKAKIEFY